jgi:hypothetical protein
MPNSNHNKRRRAWSQTDIKSLRALARRRTGAKTIAKSLHRSEGATRQKAHTLGISMSMS